MLGTLFNFESRPDLTSIIRENEFSSIVCGFNAYIPVKSTFSRGFNNKLYHNADTYNARITYQVKDFEINPDHIDKLSDDKIKDSL